jgi:hypothetical protein
VSTTRLLLVTGEWVAVNGATEEVARQLEDASRSSTGTLAWLKDEDGERFGLNPSHVVVLRAGDE